jgi:hypothetical protein
MRRAFSGPPCRISARRPTAVKALVRVEAAGVIIGPVVRARFMAACRAAGFNLKLSRLFRICNLQQISSEISPNGCNCEKH